MSTIHTPGDPVWVTFDNMPPLSGAVSEVHGSTHVTVTMPNGDSVIWPARQIMAKLFVTAGMLNVSDLHHFTTEASDLGLRPGHWPQQIATDIGNGLPFIKSVVLAGGAGVTYLQANGCIKLTVYND